MPEITCYRCKEPMTPQGSCGCADNICLIHGDCRLVLPLLEEGSVGLVLTDPPYGIGYQHSGHLRGEAAIGQTQAANRRGSLPIHGDDKPFDPRHLWRYLRVLVWGADRFREHLPAGGTLIAWDKALDRGPADTFVDGEFAWCNWREPRNVFRMLWKGLACDKRGENNGLRWHPAQKPERLMRWCLERAGGKGMVLDPYLGSGTTLRAAKDLGRRAIGIEIEEKYVRIAAERLRQQVLF